MLKNLEIQNVALIDNLKIDFLPNLNVLSGETGAGKSIIVDALNFVIGGKPNKTLIKQNKDFMKVQALFVAPFSLEAKELLKEYDIDDDEELLIMRKFCVDGKSDIKINGNTLTLSMLKNITSTLIDIHGQHEHQHLLKDKFHLEIIDTFVKDKKFHNLYQEKLLLLKNLQSQISKLNGTTENQERILDLLNYQIKEIENAKLKLGEDEELQQRKNIMNNHEKIFDAINNSLDELDGQNSTLNSLKKAQNLLSPLSKYDENFTELASRIESIKFELMDIVEVLRQKKDDCNFDKFEFEKIDERLDKIKSIKKKYGITLEEVFKFLDKSKLDYDNILNGKDKLIKLIQEKDVILKDIYEYASRISSIRKQIAEKFENDVKKELNDLGMKNANFRVYFGEVPPINNFEDKLTSTGFDDIKFLFSANAGQSLKPLSEIISGGEASRFMLALKNILADNDNISSMVFDEIDTGISGDMGYKVACKLANISKSHQVMSVSHLPQICAMADNNIKIEKQSLENSTLVLARTLNTNEALQEISRLSGGTEGSQISIEHAKELKNRCNLYKKNSQKL